MLGSLAEADDAVQEAWLRLSRADTSEVENLRGWLTTVVARVCLDVLRSRTTRAETPSRDLPEPIVAPSGSTPSRTRCSPTRSGSRSSWCSRRSRPPSASRSCSTIVRRVVRRDRPDRRSLAGRDEAAREPRPPPRAGRAGRTDSRPTSVVEAFLAAPATATSRPPRGARPGHRRACRRRAALLALRPGSWTAPRTRSTYAMIVRVLRWIGATRARVNGILRWRRLGVLHGSRSRSWRAGQGGGSSKSTCSPNPSPSGTGPDRYIGLRAPTSDAIPRRARVRVHPARGGQSRRRVERHRDRAAREDDADVRTRPGHRQDLRSFRAACSRRRRRVRRRPRSSRRRMPATTRPRRSPLACRGGRSDGRR